MLKRILRYYVYLRVGISNYITFFIALFNTASLVWYFTRLKDIISFKEFALLFFLIYIPIALVLGYYDLKKLVAKTQAELSPFWRRANFISAVGALSSIVGMSPIVIIAAKSVKDESTRECLRESIRAHLEYILSEGNYVPRNPCWCELAKKMDLLDEEHYKMCVEVAKELK